MTVHTNEASYLTHTQAKRHLNNLARRAAREAAKNEATTGVSVPTATGAVSSAAAPTNLPRPPRIGRPQFTVKKVRDPLTRYPGFLIHLHYPNILPQPGLTASPATCRPFHRFMSAFEQRLEAPNKNYQYLLVAGEPYDTVAFKVPNKELYKEEGPENLVFSHWDPDFHVYTIQVLFKID
jgi:splicing factor 3A subunit 2